MIEDKHLETNPQEVVLDRSPSARNIHAIVFEEAESELKRSSPALLWSGLAAGLSMGFSMISEGLLKAYLPDAEWSILVSTFGYSMGFLIVVLGKQQLFTENTLTPILPLLHRKNMATFLNVGRLWGIVLFANLLSALIIARAIAYTSIFEPHVMKAFEAIGKKAMEPGFGTTLLRAVFAGWLIALMVWLLPYADAARVWVIIIITYIVGIGHFSHVVAGAVETFTLAATQQVSWFDVLGNYILPTLIGNILGGVILVAAINYAQIKAGRFKKGNT
ncbi:formate/nitrite transporter family protein [Pontibacter mangrovi]|uniref:Formate/nitrite transporter family protein n=2 Tax=Pseudomonadati TaxID=3379134 RepID=A0A501WJZ1_9RHOB|nr:formate/nitrite transporter family protein [Pontibacter mangrovi]TPE41508.1 formate/nitrite transporter family protein [Pontibacter mangrovi]TPE48700.1 formate/nitrite transporter family protein [Amaricoccus solimangrovi]